ncbi:MAG: hypothetical protein IPH04_22530 [Saprospirales bacterium]|nr:hypothetical protein [Saprospirales bacterium]
MKFQPLRILLAGLLALFFFQAVQAQSSAYDKLQRGYVTLGLNGGLSYQTSEVQARYNGYGLGLTLAKNLWYHAASPITVDIRGRFLYARQYGLDGVRSLDIADNIGLNGSFGLDYLDYPANLGVSQGFVYHNYRTTLGELAAEAVFSWHTNRLGPGIFFSLYGGAGLDYFVPRIDQANASGAEYYEEYAQLDGSKGKNRRELLNSILDGNYETIPDNFPVSGETDFVLSLGAEVGIQLNHRFAVSLGHRVTFSGNNLLDGHQWEDSKGDLYHYTNLGLHWTLQSGAKKEKGKGPDISIIVPSQRPYHSNTSSGQVKARITNVQSAADIICTVNGQRMPFDYYGGDFALSFPLRKGKNDVNIQASNPYGRDLETVTIYYQTGGSDYIPPAPSPGPVPPPAPPAPPAPIPSPAPPPPSGSKPTVKIEQPATQLVTQKPTASVKAVLKGVGKASDITFLANGQKVTGFDYNPSTGVLTHLLPLKEGQNTISIKGTNTYGSAEASVKVTFEKPVPPPPPPPPPPPAPKKPLVDITQPDDKTVVAMPSVEVRATLKNIVRKDQITFIVNNSSTGNFTFSNGMFLATAPLRSGDNSILIRVKNDDGQAEDAIQVSYRVPPPPTPEKPEIRFTQPSQPGAGSIKASYTVKATVSRVEEAGDIVFKMNGKEMKGFQFDPESGLFAINVTLAEGQNDFELSANNAGGSAAARTSVNLKKPDVISPGEKPTIDITSISQPASNPLNPNVATSSMKALITGITRKEQILFTVNGNAVTDFTYDPETGAFSTTLILTRGSNAIVLKATNRIGSAEERRTIEF